MSEVQTNPTGITKTVTVGQITLDKLEPSKFKKDMLQATIRQIIKTVTHYPSQKIESDMQNSLVATDEFGLTTQDFETVENRVAFVPMPKDYTEEKTKAAIAAANAKGAVIYKVLSNEPYLDNNQKAGVAAGLTTVDIIANKQAVRYPTGHAQEGQLILDPNGNVQYRRTFYWGSPKADQDLRSVDKIYLTPELKAELQGASVMEGQTV